jgi:hypothetical protein
LALQGVMASSNAKVLLKGNYYIRFESGIFPLRKCIDRTIVVI